LVAMKTILAPIDLSEAAAGVISEAGALAGEIGGRVLLLHVVPPAVINEYAPEAERLAEKEGKEAERGMGQWQQRLKRAGVVADAAVKHGPPVATILAEAARSKADYIVMGSHGHGSLYQLFVGGTAGGVIQKAPCPVVVVPSQKTEARPSVSQSKTA